MDAYTLAMQDEFGMDMEDAWLILEYQQYDVDHEEGV